MRFADWREKFLAAYSAYDTLRDALRFNWRITDTVGVSLMVSSYGRDEVTISFQTFAIDPQVAGMFSSGYGGRSLDPFRECDAATLRKLIAAKLYIDRWTAGEIDELPKDTPTEVLTA